MSCIPVVVRKGSKRHLNKSNRARARCVSFPEDRFPSAWAVLSWCSHLPLCPFFKAARQVDISKLWSALKDKNHQGASSPRLPPPLQFTTLCPKAFPAEPPVQLPVASGSLSCLCPQLLSSVVHLHGSINREARLSQVPATEAN